MRIYTGKQIHDEISLCTRQQDTIFIDTEFYKADEVHQSINDIRAERDEIIKKYYNVLVDIYWQTTCDMTRQYLQNKTNIDFEKALKDK